MNRREFLIGSGIAIAQAGLSYGQENSQNSKKQICLTIDDGPGIAMPDMLSILGDDNPVVFYCLGRNIDNQRGRELTRQAIMQGHIIGNHSYSHPEFSKISLSKAREEITNTDRIIEEQYEAVGLPRPKRLFRFPYGDPGYWSSGSRGAHGTREKRDAIRSFLSEMDYTTQFWDTDTLDWRYYSRRAPLSLSTILSNAMSAKDGDIVLMHDRAKVSVAIINKYLDSGKFEFILP